MTNFQIRSLNAGESSTSDRICGVGRDLSGSSSPIPGPVQESHRVPETVVQMLKVKTGLVL